MTAQGPLVLHAQEQAAEELAFYTQIKVLARGIVHVDVHGADGNALPRSAACRLTWCVWYGAARASRVVPRTDGRGIRIEDGIATIGAEVEQRIERRVPCTVGPDVVEDAVIKDAVSSADGHLALSLGVPSEADTGTEVMVLRFPHPADRARDGCFNTGGVMRPIAASEINELRDISVILAWSTKAFPAKP